jgi:hypothetical protein
MPVDLQTPPRPRLALRVGVSGHRINRLLAADCDVEATRMRVREALTEIKRAALEARDWYPGVYNLDDALFRVISPLAEGADQIVADEGVRLGYKLNVLLPFDASQYTSFFDAPKVPSYEHPRETFDRLMALECVECVQQMDGLTDAEHRPASYMAVGDAVIRHSDILIAIWDGTPAKGLGGTADVVDEAQKQEIPVVWINPTSAAAWKLILPPRQRDAPPLDQPLGAVVRDLLALPSAEPSEDDDESEFTRLTEYLSTQPRKSVHGLFNFLVRASALEWPFRKPGGRKQKDFVGLARDEWTREWNQAPAIPHELQGALRDSFLAYYAWADGLADQFGSLYRNVFSLMYLLAPLAVVGALLAEFGPGITGVEGRGWSWVALAELALLAWILWRYRQASAARYHRRWIDYRSLAEQVRHLVFLWPLGRPARTLRFQGESATEVEEFSWMAWYCRAIVREAAVCGAVMTPEYLSACRSLLLDRVLPSQIQYHIHNERRMHRVQHNLHIFATSLFAAAAVIAIVHLGGLWYEGRLSLHYMFGLGAVTRVSHLPEPTFVTLGILSVLFPTVAATVHGFLSQGDFWNISRRSRRMHQDLAALRERIADRSSTGTELGDAAEDAAASLRDEVLHWRVFVRLKPISLV